MARQRYLLALGSNRRHPRHGAPPLVLRAAVAELARRGLVVERVSAVHASAPLGPSMRRYANGAMLVRTDLAPGALLEVTQAIERQFGRRRSGRRWSARVLDIDLVLWSGGPFASAALTVPHPLFRQRDFVLRPALAIAPDWRDPITGLTIRQLRARLTRPRPIRSAHPHTTRTREGP